MADLEIDLTGNSQDPNASITLMDYSPPQSLPARQSAAAAASPPQSNISAQSSQQRRRGGRKRRRNDDESWTPTEDAQGTDHQQSRHESADGRQHRRRGAAQPRRQRTTTDLAAAAPAAARAAPRRGSAASARRWNAPSMRRASSSADHDPMVGIWNSAMEAIRGMMGGPSAHSARAPRLPSLGPPLNRLLHRHGSFGPEDYERLLALDEGVQRDNGLSPALLDRLPVFPFVNPEHKKANNVGAASSSAASSGGGASAGTAEKAEPDCSVCLGDFEHHDVVCALPCCHKYHHACITPWLKSNNSCPVCKRNVAEMLQRSMQPPAPAAAPPAAASAASTSASAAASLGQSSRPSAASVHLWLPGMPISAAAASSSSSSGSSGSSSSSTRSSSDSSSSGAAGFGVGAGLLPSTSSGEHVIDLLEDDSDSDGGE